MLLIREKDVITQVIHFDMIRYNWNLTQEHSLAMTYYAEFCVQFIHHLFFVSMQSSEESV